MDKSGILDPAVMHPILEKRSNDEPSILAEMAVKAAKKALESAGKTPNDIDAVITACSNLERAYPAISIEVQGLVGVNGFAFDMTASVSSLPLKCKPRSSYLGGFTLARSSSM